jgi:hypothetical protein
MDTELATLRRNFTHALTTLDVCRRKWQAVGGQGKEALTGCVNSRLKLAHAEGQNWPVGFAAVRQGIMLRAMEQQRASEAAIGPVLQQLEEVVSSMRTAMDTLRTRLRASMRVLGGQHHNTALIHGESVASLLARAEEVVHSFGRELQLRRTLVAQLAGIDAQQEQQQEQPQLAAAAAGWDADARLLLSAWVLEPHLDHDRLDLLFDSLAAEQAPTRRR